MREITNEFGENLYGITIDCVITKEKKYFAQIYYLHTAYKNSDQLAGYYLNISAIKENEKTGSKKEIRYLTHLLLKNNRHNADTIIKLANNKEVQELAKNHFIQFFKQNKVKPLYSHLGAFKPEIPDEETYLKQLETAKTNKNTQNEANKGGKKKTKSI